jgi:hypothetical protein
MGVPVGLFGAHRNTTSGRASATWAAALSASTVKSSARVPEIQVAPGADPRDVVDAIVRLNALDGVTVSAGQQLSIPSEYTTTAP